MILLDIPVNKDTLDSFIQDSPVGQWIKHPLYNNSAGNLEIKLDDSWKKMFKEKKVQDRMHTYRDYHIEVILMRHKHYKNALQKKDFGTALFTIDKAYRVQWMFENRNLFEDANVYYENLRLAYTMAEFPLSGMQKYYVKELVYFKDKPQLMMNKDERKEFKKLSKEITIYRGIKIAEGNSINKHNLGFSFSLDKEKAEWFASRLLLPNDKAYLIEAKVKKKDILSLILDREENEVIADPDLITDFKISEIKNVNLSERDIFTKKLQKEQWSS